MFPWGDEIGSMTLEDEDQDVEDQVERAKEERKDTTDASFR